MGTHAALHRRRGHRTRVALSAHDDDVKRRASLRGPLGTRPSRCKRNARSAATRVEAIGRHAICGRRGQVGRGPFPRRINICNMPLEVGLIPDIPSKKYSSLHCYSILTFISYLSLSLVHCELDAKGCTKRRFCFCVQSILRACLESKVGQNSR